MTPTKMSFAAVSGFDDLPDNSELTFEVTIGETTLTKATTLLAGLKRLQITELSVNDAGDITLKGVNLDGATGYHEDEISRYFPITVSTSGGSSATVSLWQDLSEQVTGYWGANTTEIAFTAGDEVTASITTDPAKTAWKQETVSKTATVTA